MNFLLKKGPISETMLNFQGVSTPPCNQQQPPLKIGHLSKKKGVSFPFATMCSGVNMLVLGRATAKDVNIRSTRKLLKQQNLNFQIWLYTSFFFMQLIKQDKQPTITMIITSTNSNWIKKRLVKWLQTTHLKKNHRRRYHDLTEKSTDLANELPKHRHP